MIRTRNNWNSGNVVFLSFLNYQKRRDRQRRSIHHGDKKWIGPLVLPGLESLQHAW
jgi:hypothetical protein